MSQESFKNAAGQVSNVFASWTAAMKPSMENMNKQFQQFQQLAKEKVLTNTDVTELPTEYRQLEEKVDKVRIIHLEFLKLTRNYGTPAHDYDPPVADKLTDFASVVTAEATSIAGKLAGGSLSQNIGNFQQAPPTFAHAYAKAAFRGAELIGEDEPFGKGLKKFAKTQEKIGNLKVQHDSEALLKMHNPFLATLETKVSTAMKARDVVLSCRLTYDSCRARLKTCSPSRAEAIRAEMTKAEDEFVQAVDEAMGKMKELVENGQPLKCLADLVAIELDYHKSAYEIFTVLGPELDELVVTNEALYSS